MTDPAGHAAGLVTERLVLTPAGMDELAAIAALHADERVWRHRPEGRHTSVEHTRETVSAMERQWSLNGLGYWVARLRAPLAKAASGTFVGVGGCATDSGTAWWNLYYRLSPELQGHGLAVELSRAALRAARAAHPERPVIASLVEENRASAATAERSGLTVQWRGVRPNAPDITRLIYADRPLPTDLVSAIVNHT